MQIKALKVDKGAFCSKLASSGKMRKHMYLCKEKYLCQKQEHIGHCSHVRFELVFEWNTSCKSKFSRWRNTLFFSKQAYSGNLKKQMYLLKENHVC
jgi:hypothetical protein